GTGAKPTIEYLQVAEEDRGSGACLKAFGVGVTVAKFDRYTFCGTDEAPNETQKNEIEKFAPGGERGKEKPEEEGSLESIPVLQAPVAIIIHLPKGCTASAEFKEGEKIIKLSRLVLRDDTLEDIYRGELNTWKEVIEEEEGVDKLKCTGGEPEETKEIIRVVRKDKSGTTHIFKEFLASANRLNGAGEENALAEEKWIEKPAVERTWREVASGPENAEWPEAAKVVRPAGNGNAEVVAKVAAEESSIAYANLADVFENGAFDKKSLGGGEKQVKFWVELQKKTTAPFTYADPAAKKDTETAGNANCGKTVYTDGKEVFPPKNTRRLWNTAQSKLNVLSYSLCGLTYDLALRQYGKYHDELEEKGAQPTEAQATTVESYLLYEVNTKTAGGGKVIAENHEYEKLPSTLLKEVETGIKEIGYNVSGVKFTCTKEAVEGTGTLFYKTLKECETLNAPGSKGLYHR
ncbi:MAG: substrate-binding domain-containing protein, partial [Solirubrobacterales bacterium]